MAATQSTLSLYVKLMTKILDARYAQIKRVIRRLLKKLTDDGTVRQIQMYRSSQAFDYGPMMDAFDQMLNNAREKSILETRKDIEHVTFQIKKLRSKLAERGDSGRVFGGTNWELRESLERMSTRVQTTEKEMAETEMSRKKSLNHEEHKCSIAAGLAPLSRRVVTNLKFSLRDVRNETEELLGAYKMTFDALKRRFQREYKGLTSQAVYERRQRLARQTEEMRESVAEVRQKREELENTMGSFVKFVSGMDGDGRFDPSDPCELLEKVFASEYERVRFEIEKQVCERWGYQEGERLSIGGTILATVNARLKALEESQARELELSRRRRNMLQEELSSLLVKIKKLETDSILTDRSDDLELSELDQSRDEFQRRTEMIDDSLRELAKSHKRYARMYFA